MVMREGYKPFVYVDTYEDFTDWCKRKDVNPLGKKEYIETCRSLGFEVDEFGRIGRDK